MAKRPKANATASGDTADRIAALALASFTEKGFAATSVREIAQRVGVTIPTIYYHFGSKDGLLASVVQPFVIDGQRLLDELSADEGPRRPSRALAGYYDVLVAHLEIFRFVVGDPSVRSHELAGRRLAQQAGEFLVFLTDGLDSRGDWVRANAALGAIRRPLRLSEIDCVADRPQILRSARAALRARA